jgi:plastocyanin
VTIWSYDSLAISEQTGLWNSGVLGETLGRIFRKAGVFKYHCTFHLSVMRGIITIT